MLGQHRSTQRKAPRAAEDEAALTADIVDLARRYGRYGYRRITALLRDTGWAVNRKRVERIWRREGLKVPQRQPKRGRLWLADGSCIRLRPERANHDGPTTSRCGSGHDGWRGSDGVAFAACYHQDGLPCRPVRCGGVPPRTATAAPRVGPRSALSAWTSPGASGTAPPPARPSCTFPGITQSASIRAVPASAPTWALKLWIALGRWCPVQPASKSAWLAGAARGMPRTVASTTCRS